MLTVRQVHQLCIWIQVGAIYLLKALEIGLHHVVDLKRPEMVVSETLPFSMIGIRDQVLIKEHLKAFGNSRSDSITLIFIVGYSHHQLYKLKPDKCIIRI